MEETITVKPDGKVFLTLHGKEYKPCRFIGTIHNETFYTYRTDSKNQKYNHSNSLGICHKLIKDAPADLVRLICIEYQLRQLWTSRGALLQYGNYKHYKHNGLEVQLHLPLEKFHNTDEEARAELRKIQLSDAINFKQTASQKLKSMAGAFHRIKQEVLFNEII